MTKEILYHRTYGCLFDATSFDVWLLYSSARDKYQRLDELFDIPIYVRPVGDEEFVNYALIEVKVCPSCLFASNDPAMFESHNRFIPSLKPDPAIVKKVLAGAETRRALAPGAAGLQGRERSFGDAMVSYKLAVASATALYDAGPRTYATEIVRAGNMALKAARLAGDLLQPDERTHWLQVAFGYLSRAKEASLRGVALYKSLYQLAVVSMVMGEDLVASRCHEEMRKLTESEPTRELHAYFNRFRRVWEDRDLSHRKPS